MRVLPQVALVLMVSPLGLGQTQPSTNSSRPFGPNACGPVDPSYIRAANETGGIPMFLQRSEAAKSFHLVRESSRDDMATVLWATGTLDGPGKTLRIPVDSATRRVTFSFSGETKGNEFKLTGPSGAAVTEGTNTEVTDLNCGRIMTVSSPEAGEWHAEITGQGRYWLRVQAQSDISFVSAEFVKEGGRPGHEGLFPIQGEPVRGRQAKLEVSLSAGATETTELYLVTEEGEPIEDLQMHTVNSDQPLEFVGSVELPTVPFRIAVKGGDLNGKLYQRFFSKLFHAESVEVSPRVDTDELSPGSTERVAFNVENFSAPRSFKITVTDAHQFVTQVEPDELTLGAGESGIVRVDLTVPGTAWGAGDDVVFVATADAGPPTSNFSVVHFSVSDPATQDPR